MPASEDRAISDFPIASSLTNRALALLSAPDGQGGYDSVHAELNEIGRTILETEYTQDIDTVDKSVFGGINENKSVIGYSYDEYDATTAYSTGDLCIYNNTLYKAKQATTGNLPTSTTYWEPTSIADEIGRIDTALSAKTDFVRVGWGNSIETAITNHSQYLVLVGGAQVYLVWVAGETDINILRFTDMQTFNSTTGTWTDSITNRVFSRVGGSSSHKLTVTTPNETSLTIIG